MVAVFQFIWSVFRVLVLLSSSESWSAPGEAQDQVFQGLLGEASSVAHSFEVAFDSPACARSLARDLQWGSFAYRPALEVSFQIWLDFLSELPEPGVAFLSLPRGCQEVFRQALGKLPRPTAERVIQARELSESFRFQLFLVFQRSFHPTSLDADLLILSASMMLGGSEEMRSDFEPAPPCGCQIL